MFLIIIIISLYIVSTYSKQYFRVNIRNGKSAENMFQRVC